MRQNIPSQKITLLQSLIGRKIVFVSRYLFKADFDVDDFQQNADGYIELECDNGSVIHFGAFTEGASVAIFEGRAPVYGESYVYMDISSNPFWSSRIGQKITDVYFFQLETASGYYVAECVLEIIFENKARACIEYIDDNGEIFDALRVTSEFDESNLVRHNVLAAQ